MTRSATSQTTVKQPDPPARYMTAPRPGGLHQIVRTDGLPLGEMAIRAVQWEAQRARERERERLAQVKRDAVAAGEHGKRLHRLRAARELRLELARHGPPGVPDGAELRRRREALCMSQRHLAAEAGLSRGLIAGIELGTRLHWRSRERVAATLKRLEAEA